MSLTRSKLEQLVDPLIERCRGPVLKAPADAKLKPSDIDEVVLVGGMTRMPKIQWLVKDMFGKEGHKGVNPDEVVAIGAAIQGAPRGGDDPPAPPARGGGFAPHSPPTGDGAKPAPPPRIG